MPNLNKRIVDLPLILANDISSLDVLPIVNVEADVTNKVTIGELANYFDSSDTFLTGVTYNTLEDNLTLSLNNGTSLSADIPRYNRWFIPSGQTYTIEGKFQSFIYGDLVVEGTLNLEPEGQLVVLNGDIILSGGSIIGSGTTYAIDLPEYNVFVTGGTYNSGTKSIDFSGNLGFPPFAVDLTDLKFTGNTSGDCISDIFVSNIHSCSPLHINPNNEGNVYFGSNSGVTIDVVNNNVNVSNSITAATFYGDGSNLTGISSLVNYSNVAFVDAINGNNTTGTINDFTKPFTTIPSAISALVTAGQTNRGLVYVRRGTYNNNIVNLADGVDVYCEPGVILGGDSRVRDNGVAVTSNFFGYAKILNTSGVEVFRITADSFITFEFDEIICTGAAFSLFCPTLNNKIFIKGNNISATTLGFGYGCNIRNATNVDVHISVSIQSIHSVIRCTAFTGKAHIKCPKIVLSTGNIYGGNFKHCLYLTNFSTTGTIKVDGDLICEDTINYGGISSLVRYWESASPKLTLNGNVLAENDNAIVMTNGAGTLTYSGIIKTNRTALFLGTSSKANIKNTTIIRVGDISAGPINIANSSTLYINDTTLYSEFLNGNLINIESNTASLFIKDMVAEGVGINYFVNVGTATPTVGLINVVSNKDNHPSFVNAYTVAGSFHLEPNLNVPKFI